MPEGDAVRRTADRLDQALAGQTLTGSDFRVPQLATADLAGAQVERTDTHGKHLLTRLVPRSGPPLTLHTHLKMEGSWRTTAARARWPGAPTDVRVVLTTARTAAIGLRLGLVELFPTADQGSFTGHLGPDLLGAWAEDDREEAVARLTADPQRILGEALLDQRVVAGVGTIWLAESCFVHGVHPLGPVAQVREPARFLGRVRQMLQLAVRSGRPVTTGEKRNPLWVYGRQRQPCLRCGTQLLTAPVGTRPRERTTYWCPSCQPMQHQAGPT